jgi:hypothetical protein
MSEDLGLRTEDLGPRTEDLGLEFQRSQKATHTTKQG